MIQSIPQARLKQIVDFLNIKDRLALAESSKSMLLFVELVSKSYCQDIFQKHRVDTAYWLEVERKSKRPGKSNPTFRSLETLSVLIPIRTKPIPINDNVDQYRGVDDEGKLWLLANQNNPSVCLWNSFINEIVTQFKGLENVIDHDVVDECHLSHCSSRVVFAVSIRNKVSVFVWDMNGKLIHEKEFNSKDSGVVFCQNNNGSTILFGTENDPETSTKVKLHTFNLLQGNCRVQSIEVTSIESMAACSESLLITCCPNDKACPGTILIDRPTGEIAMEIPSTGHTQVKVCDDVVVFRGNKKLQSFINLYKLDKGRLDLQSEMVDSEVRCVRQFFPTNNYITLHEFSSEETLREISTGDGTTIRRNIFTNEILYMKNCGNELNIIEKFKPCDNTVIRLLVYMNDVDRSTFFR